MAGAVATQAVASAADWASARMMAAMPAAPKRVSARRRLIGDKTAICMLVGCARRAELLLRIAKCEITVGGNVADECGGMPPRGSAAAVATRDVVGLGAAGADDVRGSAGGGGGVLGGDGGMA